MAPSLGWATSPNVPFRQEPPVVKKLIIVALVALGVTAAVKVAKGR
ncbi:hypothetical protein [Nocardioides sp. L-11A]|nr:hypothetical protein QJ852_13960 [Nocardioides sp. L-11A]